MNNKSKIKKRFIKMKKAEDYWYVKPNTRNKLDMLTDIFDIWLTIWNGKNQQKWVSKEWYIIDLFAGKGSYLDENNEEVSGSPLIFLERILSKFDKINANGVKIKLFFVEIISKYSKELNCKILEFRKKYPQIDSITEINLYNGDCNIETSKIINKVVNKHNSPVFLFIDPWGIKIQKDTIREYIKLNNPIDILLNYSKEGVKRTKGVAIKEDLTSREVKTVESLDKFLGKEVGYRTKKDLDILKDYINTLFVDNSYNVVGFDMEYPTKEKVIYYLLFASKNETVTNKIVKKTYANYKEKTSGTTLFGIDYYLNSILSISPKIKKISKDTLLYKTKVEYGDWTINHVLGCMHGCNFPCYAMLMAKRFGWVKSYDDWRKPKIVSNALELLEKEIPKYKNEIDYFVHLSFMSDPFMYDYEKSDLVPEVKDLTLSIIQRLNQEGIRVTTLTKGFYPNEIVDSGRFLRTNEYGITLVSLNEKFKKDFEPFSAPYEKRISSLKRLAEKGLNTWVSIEPYPTPELDEGAENIEKLLDRIVFVKKLIFGKLNYRRLAGYNYNSSHSWKNNIDFYEEMSKKVIDFCTRNNIKYHIKSGTPLSKRSTLNIFKD